MPNFHNKHQKLLSAILVAVFVVAGVGIFIAADICRAGNLQNIEYLGFYSGSNYALYKDTSNNYFIGESSTYGENDFQTEVFYPINQNYGSTLEGYKDRGVDPKDYFFVSQYQDQKIKDAKPGVQNTTPGGTTFNSQGSTPPTSQEVNTPSSLEQIFGSMIAWFLYYIAVGLGWIMMLITKVMLIIAVFNNFLGQPVVKVGWTITRDLCNNFFIILMMILAGGQVLHLPNYQWKSMLPKILIFAVLINFSMTFTGILIDVSQVIMLYFASPLATVRGYNIIISAFGLPDAFHLKGLLATWASGSKNGELNPTGQSIQFLDIIAALLFAIIVTIVSIVVISCILAILAYRVIMLMFLVILSPLYFFSKATSIGGIGSIGNEWMSKLTSMLTVGPAMLFFLYLSFMIMASVNNLKSTTSTTDQRRGSILQDAGIEKGLADSATATDVKNPITPGIGTSKDYTALSDMASPQGVLNFVIVIGLLWASLMMGKKFGDAVGGVAGKGMSWLSGAAKKYSGFNLGKSAGSAALGRGKEFIGDVTGATRIAGATKMYFEEQKKGRATARSARTLETAERISRGVGATKKFIGDRVVEAGKMAKGVVQWDRFGGRKAAVLAEEAKTDASALSTLEADKNSKEQAAEESKQMLEKMEQEKSVLEQIRDNLAIYNNPVGGHASGNMTIGGYRYSKNGAGEWEKIDAASGKVVKSGIKESEIKEESTGSKNDLDIRAQKAEAAYNAGRTAEANFDEGGYRYTRDGLVWRRTDLKTGLTMGSIAAGGNIRNFATGYNTESDSVNAQIGNKDADIITQRTDYITKDGERARAESTYASRETSLEAKRSEVERLKKRQAAADKWGRRGLVAAMAAGGAALAPVGALGLSGVAAGGLTSMLGLAGVGAAGGAVAGKGMLGVADSMATAGKGDFGLFKNYNIDRISESSKGLSDLDGDEVLAKLEDTTLRKFERIAYELEAIKRGLIDDAKAGDYKEHILQETMRGGKNDAKVNSALNAALSKNYLSQMGSYEQFTSADPAEVAKGRQKLQEMIKERRYQLKDLDDTALDGLMSLYTETIKDFDAFKRQVIAAEGKEDKIIAALRNTMASSQASAVAKDKAGEYLARLTDIDSAFGSNAAGKGKFVKALSDQELLSILRDRDEKKVDALVAYVAGDLNKLSQRVQKLISSGSSDGKKLQDRLGI